MSSAGNGVGDFWPARWGLGRRAQTHPRLKLYVTNSEGDDITVIDLGRLKVIGNVKVGDHVHGSA